MFKIEKVQILIPLKNDQQKRKIRGKQKKSNGTVKRKANQTNDP
jgi:hypothetical protein